MDELGQAGQAPAIERLRAAVAVELAAQATQAAAIQEMAREVDWDEDAEFDVVGTRPIRIGADGTRLVDEHLPLEVAAALGVSVDAAMWLIRDVVNLAARLPRLWHAVQTGGFALWRARRIAQDTDTLDRIECLQVDRLIAPALGRVSARRLRYLLRAAMLQVAPEKARAEAERSKRDRYVHTGTTPEDPASSWLAGRLDTADARGFDDLLDRLADGLAARGETGDRNQLRAKAVGLLTDDLIAATTLLDEADALVDGTDAEDAEASEDAADSPDGLDGARAGQPTAAAVATRPARRPRRRRPHEVYVHLTGPVTPDTIADVEGSGPMLADQLLSVLGDRPIHVTPVMTVNSPGPAVGGYAIPRRIREDVFVRDRFEVFPYSSRRARTADLDHTIPYDPDGPPDQTRPGNLGPLSRRPHRGKTHGGWTVEQPRPGVFWWRSPRGQTFRVTPQGTERIDTSDPESRYRRRLDEHLGEPPPDPDH